MTSRISTRFSADGSLAACLAARGRTAHAEVWDFTHGSQQRPRLLPTPDGETIFTQLVPLPGDRALLVRHAPDRHDLVLLGAGPSGTVERHLTTVRTAGFRLLATPAGSAAALAISWDAPQRCTVWRVLDREPWLERVSEVPGPLLGGIPLNRSGRHLAFTCHAEHPTAVRLDLRDGTLRPLLPAAGRAHPLVADPDSGLVMLAVDGPDGLQLAYSHRRGPRAGRIHVPASLAAIDGTVLPLAAAPGGGCVALQVRRGARTHLLLHRVAEDRLTEVDIPPGLIGGIGAWSASGLRFPYTSPACPSAIATVGGSAGRWRLAGLDPAPAGQARHGAHLEWFPGSGGDIEAVVYGDWRHAERVVVALHGGPEAAWELGYHPTLQRLAAAGCAVVAPNQRGSIGYGAAHAAAIQDAWGGPDRDDIHRLGRVLRRRRPAGATAPMLFGESYGAYLALLVAGHHPQLWSRCAVVAPFLSGARLYDHASTAVRELLDRRGGRTPLPRGAGDVLAVADHISGPLLLVHGDRDTTVPVGQSRTLRDHLRRPGRPTPADLAYLEVPGADHDLLTEPGTALEVLVRFLGGSPQISAAAPAAGHRHPGAEGR